MKPAPDKIAREVVEPGSDGLRRLVDAFGPEILGWDGSLDRPALAARVFSDDEQRQKLNAVTHPLIGARTQASAWTPHPRMRLWCRIFRYSWRITQRRSFTSW